MIGLTDLSGAKVIQLKDGKLLDILHHLIKQLI